MRKIHPVFFISITLNNFPFLISSHSRMHVCVSSQRPRTSRESWLALVFNLRPSLSELSSVSHCFDAGADVDNNGSWANWVFLLLDVIMNTFIIYYWHLSCWRHSGLRLFLKGNASSDLPKCVYVRLNHSWSSLAYRRSEYKVLLWRQMQITFPNNVLASKFTAKVNSLLITPRREGRGQQSSLAFKGTWTKMAYWKQSWFWQGKKGVVLH